MSKNVQLTTEQFFDYMYCPAYFDMKYIKQLDVDSRVTLPDLLDQLSRYFYYQILNGRIPSPDELKKRWDMICNENEDFMTPEKGIQGIGLILQMFEWASREKLFIIDVSTPYSVNIGNVHLSGHIPALIGIGSRDYEILVTLFSKGIPDSSIIDMSLKNTFYSYACKHIIDKPEQGIRVHSVRHEKTYYTQRNEEDYKRLETAVLGVGNAIANNVYYPREGLDCKSCPAKQYCKYWYKK